MKFDSNININEYTDFFNKFKYSHFLQSPSFGIACAKTRNQNMRLIGVRNEKKELIAASLLMEKKTPLNMCYYYAPRGFLMDFNNKKLFDFFTENLKRYLKEKNAIYLKLDPEIILNYLNEDGSIKEKNNEAHEILNNFTKSRFIHKGFNKLYEGNQPRYSFRRYFNKYNSIDEINNSLSKSFFKTVKRSFNYELIVEHDSNIEGFFELNKENAKKDDFIQYPKDFYTILYEESLKNNNIDVVNIYANIKNILNNAEEELIDINKTLINENVKRKNDLIEKKNRLEKEIKTLEEYKNEEKLLICSMINNMVNKKMWTMYIGNSRLGEYLFGINRVYYETIKYCFENNYEFLDLFGTTGDIKTKYKNLAALHDYKRKFGDEYVEFIGEFDLVNKKLMYKLLPSLLSIYRKVKKHDN